jgi:hypothetical protein
MANGGGYVWALAAGFNAALAAIFAKFIATLVRANLPLPPSLSLALRTRSEIPFCSRLRSFELVNDFG